MGETFFDVKTIEAVRHAKRILVVGCPGSGKSYFAKKIAKSLSLPLYHLDNLYWNEDKTHLSREELKEALKPIFQLGEYVLDGNYKSTLDYRMEYADVVFFLDYALDTCLAGARERLGIKRDDLPFVPDEEDQRLLFESIRSFASEDRPLLLECFARHEKVPVIIFANREEEDEFLHDVFHV